jgi:hypothetical protein
VFLRIPGPRIETPFVTKGVESTLWKNSCHVRAHSPREKLDGIAGERQQVRFKVVEGGYSAADNDPEGGKEPEAKGEDRFTRRRSASYSGILTVLLTLDHCANQRFLQQVELGSSRDEGR